MSCIQALVSLYLGDVNLNQEKNYQYNFCCVLDQRKQGNSCYQTL